MPDEDGTPTLEQQVAALYEESESGTAKTFEDLIPRPGFAVRLAQSAENAAAIARLTGDAADLVLRSLRLAGRADITRLARQLARTEDKLERVLQEVEALRDELARERRSASSNGRKRAQKP